MRAARAGLLAALLVAQALPSLAQKQAVSGEDVRLWAASCSACHGPHGKAEGAGLYLAGVQADKLYTALLDFKSGKRAATVMHQHAKGYSDDELKALAEHFARVK
jgi:cytochrome c553